MMSRLLPSWEMREGSVRFWISSLTVNQGILTWPTNICFQPDRVFILGLGSTVETAQGGRATSPFSLISIGGWVRSLRM